MDKRFIWITEKSSGLSFLACGSFKKQTEKEGNTSLSVGRRRRIIFFFFLSSSGANVSFAHWSMSFMTNPHDNNRSLDNSVKRRKERENCNSTQTPHSKRVCRYINHRNPFFFDNATHFWHRFWNENLGWAFFSNVTLPPSLSPVYK